MVRLHRRSRCRTRLLPPGSRFRPTPLPTSTQLGQIDSTIEEAAKRGRTTTALTAIEALRKTREVLVAQRQREGKALADFKAERAALGAKGRQIEPEDAPIRY